MHGGGESGSDHQSERQSAVRRLVGWSATSNAYGVSREERIYLRIRESCFHYRGPSDNRSGYAANRASFFYSTRSASFSKIPYKDKHPGLYNDTSGYQRLSQFVKRSMRRFRLFRETSLVSQIFIVPILSANSYSYRGKFAVGLGFIFALLRLCSTISCL